MLSAINSVKFANINNYKKTYTNTNQNVINSQLSFCAKAPGKFSVGLLGLFMTIVSAISPATIAKAEEASKLAGKTALTTKKTAAKKHGGKIRNIQAFVDSFRGKKEVLVDDLLKVFEKRREVTEINTPERVLKRYYGKNGLEVGYYDRKHNKTIIVISTEDNCSNMFFDYKNNGEVNLIIFGNCGNGEPEIVRLNPDILDPDSN